MGRVFENLWRTMPRAFIDRVRPNCRKGNPPAEPDLFSAGQARTGLIGQGVQVNSPDGAAGSVAVFVMQNDRFFSSADATEIGIVVGGAKKM